MSLTCIALAVVLQGSPPRADSRLSALLATAVDQANPKIRLELAEALAKREGVSEDQWLAAARAFAPRPLELGPGTHVTEVPLWDGEAEVRGEIVMHVPASYDHEVPTALILAMHGTGGDGNWMLGMWKDMAEATGCLLLCPTDTGPNVGFAATDVERQTTLSALRWARRSFNVDENALFLTGFSRGGHMTWDLGLRFPDMWAALCPMVGGPRFELARGANNIRYFENLRGLPMVCMQGELDQAGLVWSVKEVFARIRKAGIEAAELHLFPDLGHFVDMQAVDWPAFLALRRDPQPKRVVRTYARTGEGRRAWMEVTGASSKVEEIFTPKLRHSEVKRLGDEGLRRAIIDASIKKTGRIDGRFIEPGSFRLESQHVTKLRLLLTQDMLPKGDQKLEIKLGSTKRRFVIRRESRVLLTDFVERFDRSYLPLAEVRISLGR